MGLLLSMAGIQSGAAQLLLGLALGAFGAFVQALPYMNRRSAAPLPVGRKRGLPGRRKKSREKDSPAKNKWGQETGKL